MNHSLLKSPQCLINNIQQSNTENVTGISMDFSQVFDDIGEFGPYQCVVCLFLAASMIPTVYSNLNTIFITGVTDYWCAVPELDSLNSSQLDIQKATLPMTLSLNDVMTYDSCSIYSRNYSAWSAADVEYYVIHGNMDNASVTSCQNGWLYDTDVYGPTATTQVIINMFMLKLM